MARTRTGCDEPDRTGADSRRPDAGRGVSAASAARTRTLDGETVAFTAQDYRPPEGAPASGGAAPRAVMPADGANLGTASGVASLRRAEMPQGASHARREPLPRRAIAGIAVGLVVVALAVFAAGYAVVGWLADGLDQHPAEATSGSYATNAFTLFAVVDDQGNLEAAYLGFVDAINERVELCRLEPTTCFGLEGNDPCGLDDIYAGQGLAGLADAVGRLAGDEVLTAATVDAGQMDRILALGAPDGTASQVAQLASEVCVEAGQMVTEPALRGLLSALADIDAEKHVVFDAPLGSTETVEGRLLGVLDQPKWLTMVQGMRDATQGVSYGA